MFHSFLSSGSSKDTATTYAHSKHIIKLLKNGQIIFCDLSTIWDSKKSCAEQYIFTTALYLLSMLAHVYNIIIDRGVGSPGNIQEVVGFLNATDKRFLSLRITNVQLSGTAGYDTQMEIPT